LQLIDFANHEQTGYFSFADLGEPPVDPNGLFPRVANVEIEVGSGRGDFLLCYGARRPDLNLIGVERNLAIMRRAVNKLRAAELPNVEFFHGEARHLFENYLPAQSVDAVHIYFPDPWPKKRHAKRRFILPENMEPVFRTIREGGFFHFRTDFEAYFVGAMEYLAAHPSLTLVPVPDELATVRTGYEDRFLSYSKPIYRASFRVAPAEVP
jgi:tRNA (guanine-N7-)-methyltransferase